VIFLPHLPQKSTPSGTGVLQCGQKLCNLVPHLPHILKFAGIRAVQTGQTLKDRTLNLNFGTLTSFCSCFFDVRTSVRFEGWISSRLSFKGDSLGEEDLSAGGELKAGELFGLEEELVEGEGFGLEEELVEGEGFGLEEEVGGVGAA